MPVLTGISTPATARRSDKKAITRNRASYSCKACRHRKVKCDKVHPACGGCQRAGEICAYDTKDPGKDAVASDAQTRTTSEGIKRKRHYDRLHTTSTELSKITEYAAFAGAKAGTVQEQVRRLTELVKDLRREAAAAASSDHSDIAEHVNNTSEKRVQHNEGHVGLSAGVNPFILESGQSQKEDTPSIIHTRATKNDGQFQRAAELASPLSTLELEQDVRQNKPLSNINNPLWTHITDELSHLNFLLRNQNQYLGPSSTTSQQRPGVATDEKPLGPAGVSRENGEQTLPHFGNEPFYNHTNLSSLAARSPFDKSILLQQDNGMDFVPSQEIAENFSALRSEEQTNVLFRSWMTGFQSVVPLLLPLHVLLKQQAYWHWHKEGNASGRGHADLEYMPLLCAMWYTGSKCISLPGLRRWFHHTTRASLSAGLHDEVVYYLRETGFPRKATLPSLTAYIILLTVPNREEEPLQSSLYLSLAIRVAQSLGLHRNPELRKAGPSEIELRKRLWWHLVHLDTSSAVSNALPPQIQTEMFDVPMCTEVKDELLIGEAGKEYQDAVNSGLRSPDKADDPMNNMRDSAVSVYMMSARALFLGATVSRKILSVHHGAKPITRAEMHNLSEILLKLSKDIDSIVSRIPSRGVPESGFAPDADQATGTNAVDADVLFGQPLSVHDIHQCDHTHTHTNAESYLVQYRKNLALDFHKWTRVMLSCMVDKLHCLAYAPFLKNAKSRIWTPARPCALRHSHGFLKKFIALANDPAFEHFYWTWPAMHQPMHAAMIVLIDLYERPSSVEAPRSRALIDRVLDLSKPSMHIVRGDDGVSWQRPLADGGKDAWSMLRDLRDKAWQKVRLDPTVLWTEEDQVMVGVAAPLSEVEKIAQILREDAADDELRRGEVSADCPQQAVPTYEGFHHAVNIVANRMSYWLNSQSIQQPSSSISRQSHGAKSQGFSHLLRSGCQCQNMPYASGSGKQTLYQSTRSQSILNSHESEAGEQYLQQIEPYAPIDGPCSDAQPHWGRELCSAKMSHSNGGVENLSAHGSNNSKITASSPTVNSRKANSSLIPDEAGIAAHSYALEGTAPNLDFDWDRCDAVFGQYASFDDMMMMKETTEGYGDYGGA